ncbi:FMRFamide-activated amiloride-sensitive sodium channel isoform X2 [Parasteatoda tepidariorum]|uniref:FMRFamide-activated amiloride-sensitive sodium channel isoform X2 n=1 Tax=Parasteatoda tepidariorum TaxID=114398 RepID=UPI00077FA318|nr:FMRFamide-activated amiloride-sensitive sodium channel isoform X2 [Parasteatoda tepidariorum]
MFSFVNLILFIQECIEYCKLDKIRSSGLCVDDQIAYSHMEELCEEDETTMTKEILEHCNSMCHPACQSAFITLQVFFRNFRLTERIYEPKYREVELFSYIGGYMGMWLGLSLVSVFDFFESLCLVLYYPIKKRIKKDN